MPGWPLLYFGPVTNSHFIPFMTNTSTPGHMQWSVQQKMAFRFFFAFFILYIVFVPSDCLPLYDNVFYPFINHFQFFIAWAAKNLLHIVVEPVTRGLGDSGGDSTFDYLLYLFVILLSATVAIIWSYTGRKTANYNKVYYWLLVVLRYFVAFTMIFFGSAKIFRVQFPEPPIGRLMERVGDMSPMGLAWIYMGYSHWFNYFTGFSELLCAGLLFFRRTTRLGATIGIVLLVNIVAVNYCFDVCVKISSTTLLLMCFFILIPDRARFINFYFRNAAVQPSDLQPHRFTEKWKNVMLTGIKYFIILFTLYSSYDLMAEQTATYGYGGPNAKRPPLYGLYQIETFVRNRDTLKPLTTDAARWNKFWISSPGRASVKFMNDSVKAYNFKPDTLKHIIAVTTNADTAHQFYLHYTMLKPDIMILEGQWKRDTIYVRLHKVDLNSFRLISRGFHMINEVPYNK